MSEWNVFFSLLTRLFNIKTHDLTIMGTLLLKIRHDVIFLLIQLLIYLCCQKHLFPNPKLHIREGMFYVCSQPLSSVQTLNISHVWNFEKHTAPTKIYKNSMKDVFRYVLVMQVNTHIFYFYSPHALEDDVFTIWLPL